MVLVVACGKSEPDYKQANPPPTKPKPAADPGSAAGSAASEPAEAAEVSGPTKSATGTVEVSGALTGTFEWKKKDQRAPITCIWDPEKEIGTLKIDLSDGAGKLFTVGLDIPPTEAGAGRLDIMSKALTATLKTYGGFKVKGEDAEKFTVTFEDAVAVTDPDAQAAAKTDKKKKAEPPPDPHVTLKGTLEVTCPKKK
ncbi:MAG TPA: hypothetical protein VL326_06015 [Kofleriaceae bacterium]|nr:hypothetical protein [Kofleriaceae bacterium]